MAENLSAAIEQRGPYVVWELMSEEDRKAAAVALWKDADRESRAALEIALARELKFRPQSLRKLPVERIVGRLVRMADSLPDTVLFQYLFHLHMAERRPLMIEYLDAVELPHNEGVLDLPEDGGPPEAEKTVAAAKDLLEAHEGEALVYLATLKVADADFWSALDEVLEGYGEDGSALSSE